LLNRLTTFHDLPLSERAITFIALQRRCHYDGDMDTADGELLMCIKMHMDTKGIR